MLQNYTRLHEQAMRQHGPMHAKRFYVAGVLSTGSWGNQAMALLSHLILAMQSGRALVYDGWLSGFDFPVDLDHTHMPEPYLSQLTGPPSSWSGSRSESWTDREQAYCGKYLPNSNEAVFVWRSGMGFGAPEVGAVASNPHLRKWFDDNLGSAGLRLLVRWFFRPARRLLTTVARMEQDMCGIQGCDIGIHIR